MAVLIVFGCHTSPSKLANFDEFPMLKGNAASASRDAVLFVSHDEMRPLFGDFAEGIPLRTPQSQQESGREVTLERWMVGGFVFH